MFPHRTIALVSLVIASLAGPLAVAQQSSAEPNPSQESTPNSFGVLDISSKPRDERLFLLHALNATYRSWPSTDIEAPRLTVWLAQTERSLTALQARARETSEAVDSLYDDAILLIGRYRDFLLGNELISKAALDQARDDAEWTSIDLAVTGAMITDKAGIPGAIVGGVLTLIGAALNENRLNEAKAKLLRLHAEGIGREFAARLAQFERVSQKLAAQHGWPAQTVDYSKDTRVFDSFGYRAMIREAVTSAKSGGQWDACMYYHAFVESNLCWAIQWIPPAETYNGIRADILSDATLLALEACEQETRGDFSAGPSPHSAHALELAAAMWRNTAELTQGAPAGAARLMLLARANAYAGHLDEAIGLAQRAVAIDENAEARVLLSSWLMVTGREVASVAELRKAYAAGFCDVRRIRQDPNFAKLRDNADAFKALCWPSCQYEPVWGEFKHDYRLRNCAPFAFTNVRLVLNFEWENGERDQKTFRVDRIEPGASHLWSNVCSTFFSGVKISVYGAWCDQSPPEAEQK